MNKRPIDMNDDELRAEIERCDFRATMLGETPGGQWSEEAKRLRRILRNRKTAEPKQDREA